MKRQQKCDEDGKNELLVEHIVGNVFSLLLLDMFLKHVNIRMISAVINTRWVWLSVNLRSTPHR